MNIKLLELLLLIGTRSILSICVRKDERKKKSLIVKFSHITLRDYEMT